MRFLQNGMAKILNLSIQVRAVKGIMNKGKQLWRKIEKLLTSSEG